MGGSSVFVHSLEGRPGLNGQRGVVVQYIPDRKRFRVHICGHGSEVVALCKVNLLPDDSTAPKSEWELKTMAHERGNALFREGQYIRAVEEFSLALLHDSGDAHVYSNRSAALCACRDYVRALQDGQQAVTIDPQFSKGWGRVAA